MHNFKELWLLWQGICQDERLIFTILSKRKRDGFYSCHALIQDKARDAKWRGLLPTFLYASRERSRHKPCKVPQEPTPKPLFNLYFVLINNCITCNEVWDRWWHSVLVWETMTCVYLVSHLVGTLSTALVLKQSIQCSSSLTHGGQWLWIDVWHPWIDYIIQ